MAKRKNGEGTYGTKKINGIEYKYYKFPNGHYIYAKKSKDLEDKKKTYEQDLNDGKFVIDNLYTFDNYCLVWLKSRKGYISDRTYDDYESIITSRIKKYPIGNMQIKSLTVKMFNDFFLEMKEKYSKASIDKTFVMVKQVLAYGIDRKEIPAINISKIIRPKETQVAVKKKDIPYITKPDMDLFEEEVTEHENKYGDGAKVLLFIMHSGLRISEAIGLRWEHVDKDYSSIHIYESRGKRIKRDKNLDPIIKDGKMVYESVQKGTKSVDAH